MELLISNPEFVNTSEAYSGNLIVSNNNIVIPYSNLHLTSNNPFTKQEGFIDFCYLIFYSVFSLKYMVESITFEILSNRAPNSCQTQFIALIGRTNGNGAEVNISFSEWKLLPLTDSVITKKKFESPKAIKNLRQLTDCQIDFLNGSSLPFEIKKLAGDNFYRILI